MFTNKNLKESGRHFYKDTEGVVGNGYPIVCFSDISWNVKFQRPHQLFSQAKRINIIIFIEKPLLQRSGKPNHFISRVSDNILILTPVITDEDPESTIHETVEQLLTEKLKSHNTTEYICWYYSPKAINYSQKLTPKLIIFDCMDECCGYEGADTEVNESEKKLLEVTDLVFTGGRSLCNAKKLLHKNVHLFPDSIDYERFNGNTKQAKKNIIKKPAAKIGYFGVIDERLDLNLLDKIAANKPKWKFEIAGPIVENMHGKLPERKNITFTGDIRDEEIPSIIGEWDAAILPYSKNNSTENTAPSRLLVYFAANKNIVSTSINDIVHYFGENGMVRIADEPDDFVKALEAAIKYKPEAEWQKKVDSIIRKTTWEKTWNGMSKKINKLLSDTDQQL